MQVGDRVRVEFEATVSDDGGCWSIWVKMDDDQHYRVPRSACTVIKPPYEPQAGDVVRDCFGALYWLTTKWGAQAVSKNGTFFETRNLGALELVLRNGKAGA